MPLDTRISLEFFAEGVPKPQGSKRYVGNGRFVEASDVKPWRAAIANAVFRACMADGDHRPFTGPVKVQATFYMPRPKTVRRLFPTVAPDLDKLQRALGDGMSVDCGIIEDDAQIVEWHSFKAYVEPGGFTGVKVKITAL